MAKRRSLSILSAGLLAASAALVAMAGAAMAVPPSTAPSVVPGNDGTVKIHDGNSESEPIVSNEPRVCTFHVHFFLVDEDQSGDWWIQSWPPTGDGTTVLSGTYLTDGEGEYRTPADPGTYSLPNGHYKLFWQGDEENLAKHKVFWVSCPDASSSASPFESFQGETATPEITPTPCSGDILAKPFDLAAEADFEPTLCPSSTPFESFQGETSGPNDTPPPTGTSQEPYRGSTPAFALLLASLFGGLGVATAGMQRTKPFRR